MEEKGLILYNTMLVVSLGVAPIILVSLLQATVYAGGARLDWDERYEDIPGAPECWVDGYDDGQDHPFDHDRNEECKDKGDQYYRAFIVGCKEAGNSEETCETFTDE